MRRTVGLTIKPMAYKFEIVIGISMSKEEKPRCCSVTESCPTLYNNMDSSTPGFLVFHYLVELAQTHVH